MPEWNKMPDLTKLATCLHNARVVVRDAFTHLYVMSEHQADMARYNLGRGAFASSISLLATLNLLAKIHHVLTMGQSAIVGESELQAFNAAKEKIKKSTEIRWAEISPFMRKPRLGDVNESDAFASFVKACPVDFGLPREDSAEARRIWATFRNKLTHLVALANDVKSGQMLMGLNTQPSRPGMYEINLQLIRGRIGTYKPFDIPDEETKAAFREKQDIAADLKQMILNDTCYVERLAVAVDMTLDWLSKAISNGEYAEEHLGVLAAWLQQELTPLDNE